MRRTFLLMAAALCLLTPIANAEAPLTGARAAILLEAETGRVLFEKNADERLAIASTTKIMTALLAIESCAMDEIVTAGKNASGVPGTSIYLSVCRADERARRVAGRERVFHHAERAGFRRERRVRAGYRDDRPGSHAA